MNCLINYAHSRTMKTVLAGLDIAFFLRWISFHFFIFAFQIAFYKVTWFHNNQVQTINSCISIYLFTLHRYNLPIANHAVMCHRLLLKVSISIPISCQNSLHNEPSLFTIPQFRQVWNSFLKVVQTGDISFKSLPFYGYFFLEMFSYLFFT